MKREFYIASCVFTQRYNELSIRVQNYISRRFAMPIVRCCLPKYKLNEFTEKMPTDYRADWAALPDCADFGAGDTVYSICHNCSIIIEAMKPEAKVVSVWELILGDEQFDYPDYKGRKMTVQDCWRSKDDRAEQEAVRCLLAKMNIEAVELADNYDQTDFCGNSLYRPAPVRNIKLAPQKFVENAIGKFVPHTIEEQREIMQEYCKQLKTEQVVTYCHYCAEGLELGGADAIHLASLLFEPEKNGLDAK